MASDLVRLEYFDAVMDSEKAGWYICYYENTAEMTAKAPKEVVGPYATKAAAARMLNSPENPAENTGLTKRQPHDPSRDPTPIPLDAGIPSDAGEEL